MVAVPPGLLSDAGPEAAAERYLDGVKQYALESRRAREKLSPEESERLADMRGTPLYAEAREAYDSGEPYDHYLSFSDDRTKSPEDLRELFSGDHWYPNPGSQLMINDNLRGADRLVDPAKHRVAYHSGSVVSLARAESLEDLDRRRADAYKDKHLEIKEHNERDDEAPTPKEGRPKKKAKPDRSGPGGKFKPARTREQYTE